MNGGGRFKTKKKKDAGEIKIKLVNKYTEDQAVVYL